METRLDNVVLKKGRRYSIDSNWRYIVQMENGIYALLIYDETDSELLFSGIYFSYKGVLEAFNHFKVDD